MVKFVHVVSFGGGVVDSGRRPAAQAKMLFSPFVHCI